MPALDLMIFEKRFKVGRIPSRVFGEGLRASLSHALADTRWGNRTPIVSGRFFSDDDSNHSRPVSSLETPKN